MTLRTACRFAFFFLACQGLAWAGSAPERIVSTAPNLTEILFALGAGDRVVAVTDFCDRPAEARGKRRIGGFANPSLEAIAALNPDLVVMSEDGNPRQVADKLRRLGIPVFAFRAMRMQDLAGEVRRLGAALGLDAQAAQTADDLRVGLRRRRNAAKPLGWQGRSVLMVIQPEPLISAGPGTSIDEALSWLGLRNIVPPSPSRYPRLSLEFVLREKPDLLLVGRDHGTMEDKAKRLLQKLRPLPAVDNGRVCFIGDGLYRLGPRIPEGLGEIVSCLRRHR